MIQSTNGLGEATRPDRVSFWVASTTAPRHAELVGRRQVDIAVIGAGIVGLTTAFLLSEAGHEVLVVEADQVAAGVSGYTTAKVTAGHGLIYSHLESAFDSGTARSYAESQTAALSLIRGLCEERSLECDFEPQANFVYAESDDDLEQLEREAAAAQRAGLPVDLVDGRELPFPVSGALRLDEQAQFHVRKYLLALASLVAEAGGEIVESSRVTEVTGEGSYVVRTDRGSVEARCVVVASHYPLIEQGFFVTRIHPRRAYVVAAPLTGGSSLPGMLINASSPTRSLRTTPLADGNRLLLVGGEGHRVGQEDDTEARYATLERFMHEHFAVGQTTHRWSTQDNFTLDRLPFIGSVADREDLYVATGFAGWGMTNGTVAAMLISDAVRGVAGPWAPIYGLERHSLLASAGRFLSENTNVAAQQVGGRLQQRPDSAAEIEPGQGAVISLDGEHVAVSRSPDGSLAAVSASCTHMGCLVSWNAAESSWDCPCHGSRFAADGRVLHGPAVSGLEAVELDALATGSDG